MRSAFLYKVVKQALVVGIHVGAQAGQHPFGVPLHTEYGEGFVLKGFRKAVR